MPVCVLLLGLLDQSWTLRAAVQLSLRHATKMCGTGSCSWCRWCLLWFVHSVFCWDPRPCCLLWLHGAAMAHSLRDVNDIGLNVPGRSNLHNVLSLHKCDTSNERAGSTIVHCNRLQGCDQTWARWVGLFYGAILMG